jgi:hypothetical protein
MKRNQNKTHNLYRVYPLTDKQRKWLVSQRKKNTDFYRSSCVTIDSILSTNDYSETVRIYINDVLDTHYPITL